MSGLAQAFRLAADSRSPEAVALLERLAASGDADALYGLGLWCIEGRHLPRDLVQAHDLIAEAEAKGSMPAARTLSALLATGAEWPAALALLERWRGRDPLAARQLDLIAAMDGAHIPEGEPVSSSPWIIRYPGFFSPGEIAFLTELAAPRFKPALVFNQIRRKFVAHPYRDAQAAAFPLVLEWPAIRALNRRIAVASGTELEQGEPLQVLRYEPGQSYREHLDAVPGLPNQRILTMLVALNDGFDGGETDFPQAGLKLRGRPGDAILFRNVGADGRPDPASMHAGLPVRHGTKLIASRWIRQQPPPAGEAFGQHEIGV